MKWYLIIGGSLLLVALGFVVGVWVMYQDVHQTIDFDMPTQDVPKNIQTQEPRKDVEAVPDSEETVAPIVIDTTTLSDTQQTMLETLGFTEGTITITQEMIACAEEAVGKERLDAITNGSAPTPFEAAKLLPCFR